MTTPVLICDDSSFARKQMARAMPPEWDTELSFASNGAEGVESLEKGLGDVLFLDLNMPVMDGYQVLETICKKDLNTIVIVVSGDIQPEAEARVMGMGALAFIKKPVSAEQLSKILDLYGVIDKQQETSCSKALYQNSPKNTETKKKNKEIQEITLTQELRDCYQEISNVAMGRAADLLARLLNVFVVLPVPNVNLIEVSEITMALHLAECENTFSAVCQGFIGAGIAGEALLVFNDSSFSDIAELMKCKNDLDENGEMELLMDTSSILIGAFLRGIADQLDINFSQGHPVILGQHCQVSELVKANASQWNKTLAIEINYTIENYQIECDLLLLFTEDSIPKLNKKASYLL